VCGDYPDSVHSGLESGSNNSVQPFYRLWLLLELREIQHRVSKTS